MARRERVSGTWLVIFSMRMLCDLLASPLKWFGLVGRSERHL
jgi:hypothetical protein